VPQRFIEPGAGVFFMRLAETFVTPRAVEIVCMFHFIAGSSENFRLKMLANKFEIQLLLRTMSKSYLLIKILLSKHFVLIYIWRSNSLDWREHGYYFHSDMTYLGFIRIS
jgi:hypothetical protein